MNNMTKGNLQKLLIIILLIISTTTCKKTVDEVPPSLTVNPPTKEVDANQGSFTINVISTIAWTANCDKSWLTIDPSQGEGNATIKGNYQVNSAATNRTATISFIGNGVSNQTITVTQLGLIPNLSISPANQNVTSVTGSTTFSMTSNTNWTATSDQPWCALTPASGTGSVTLTANYTMNTANTNRTATITISSSGLQNQTVTLTQTQFVASLSVTPPNQNVNSIAGSTTFNVASNMSWSATSDQTWCTLSNSSANGNGTITANFSANNTTGNRVANITVTGNGVSNQIVTVTQSYISPSLSVSPSNQNIPNIAGNTSFTITSNITWSATSDQNWCTFTTNQGTGNGALTANYTANSTNNQRVANITISGSGVSNQIVTVTQASGLPTTGLIAWYPFTILR